MRNTEAYCEPFATARDLVKYINNSNLQKADILDILNINGQLFLIYYA